MAKQIAYGEDARKALKKGVDQLADTVRRSAHHQRRRYDRQGNRARGRFREYGRSAR